MIPLVEVRQVRPCGECCFDWGDDYGDNYCNLHIFIPNDDRNGAPCKYHYTDEEMKELIDSGARK